MPDNTGVYLHLVQQRKQPIKPPESSKLRPNYLNYKLKLTQKHLKRGGQTRPLIDGSLCIQFSRDISATNNVDGAPLGNQTVRE